jgi:hypothetical protein
MAFHFHVLQTTISFDRFEYALKKAESHPEDGQRRYLGLEYCCELE